MDRWQDSYRAVLYASLLDPRVMRCGGMEFTAKPSGILDCLIKYYRFNIFSSLKSKFFIFFLIFPASAVLFHPLSLFFQHLLEISPFRHLHNGRCYIILLKTFFHNQKLEF